MSVDNILTVCVAYPFFSALNQPRNHLNKLSILVRIFTINMATIIVLVLGHQSLSLSIGHFPLAGDVMNISLGSSLRYL